MEENSELPTIIERNLEESTYNDQNEKVLNQVITIKSKMGGGSFSKVCLIDYKFIWDEDGEKKEQVFPYAMKILDTEQLSKKYNLSAGNKTTSYLDVAMQELEIFKKIKHDHIIKVFEIIHDENKLYVIMALADIGTIMDWNDSHKKYEFAPKAKEYLEKNSLKLLNTETLDWESLKDREIVGKYIFKQLFEAVAYIHEKNIVHRDLKWENILAKHNVDEDCFDAKIIDFSIGVILSSPDEKLTTFEGTLEYRAPEITDEPYDPKKADVWALGCCLYSFIWGYLPLTDPISYEERIQQSEEISEELKDLLKGMLDKDPSQRLAMEDVCLSLWLF